MQHAPPLSHRTYAYVTYAYVTARRVLGGSRFHLRTLPAQVQARAAVLGYALQERFFRDGPNARTEFIYASAPNRGLQQVGWGQVRVRVLLG